MIVTPRLVAREPRRRARREDHDTEGQAMEHAATLARQGLVAVVYSIEVEEHG